MRSICEHVWDSNQIPQLKTKQHQLKELEAAEPVILSPGIWNREAAAEDHSWMTLDNLS